jgi:hypothetical protein
MAGCLFVLYIVIRKAVHHGILDADDTRRDRQSRQQLLGTLGGQTHPDDHIS